MPIFFLNIFYFLTMENKGYSKALRDAHGNSSEVHYNYGWYGSPTGTEYDDNGRPIPFT